MRRGNRLGFCIGTGFFGLSWGWIASIADAQQNQFEPILRPTQQAVARNLTDEAPSHNAGTQLPPIVKAIEESSSTFDDEVIPQTQAPSLVECQCAQSMSFKERMANRGVSIDFFATQFYQGVASGGRAQEWEYGGKLDLLTHLDGQKLGLWQGFFVDAHVESRLGQSVNENDGLLTPSNIAMNFPEGGEDIVALTGLKFTQALSESFVVYAGKINTLDEFPIHYTGGAGLGRPGLGGFMNTSLVFNPIAGRTVTYAAAGCGFAVLKDLEPAFSFSAFDPRERATTGIQDIYETGVVLVPDFIFRTRFTGRPGVYNFGGTYSTADYTSVDPAAYLNLPFLGGPLPTEDGSWSLYANFYQSFWVDPCDPKRTWGLFGGFGLADGNPNPVEYTTIVGIGGRTSNRNRADDVFGVGLFNLGLSDDFKALTAPLIPQQDEYGLEWFYNRAMNKHWRLTADLQVVRPSTIGFDTSIIPGMRLQLVY